MPLAKTAKRGAKGWAGVRVAKGAGKSASKAVRHEVGRGPSTAERIGRVAAAIGIAGAIALVLAKIDRRRAEGRAVNVNDVVVELPDQAQIDELGGTARKIYGVKDVRNLLHTTTNGG